MSFQELNICFSQSYNLIIQPETLNKNPAIQPFLFQIFKFFFLNALKVLLALCSVASSEILEIFHFFLNYFYILGVGNVCTFVWIALSLKNWPSLLCLLSFHDSLFVAFLFCAIPRLGWGQLFVWLHDTSAHRTNTASNNLKNGGEKSNAKRTPVLCWVMIYISFPSLVWWTATQIVSQSQIVRKQHGAGTKLHMASRVGAEMLGKVILWNAFWDNVAPFCCVYKYVFHLYSFCPTVSAIQ